MKLVDGRKKQVKKGQFRQALRRLQEVLPLGKKGADLWEVTLARFQRALDHRYVMLCDIPVPGAEAPVPMILVGPAGLLVINYQEEKGIYRAKEDSWWEMGTTRQFRPARKNLIRQTQAYAKAVSAYLVECGKPSPNPLSVLLFSNPGVHVDASRPAVRIVLADGIERFITNLLQAGEVISLPDVRLIAGALERIIQPEEKLPEVEDIFGKDLGIAQKSKKPTTLKPARPMPQVDLPPSVTRRFAFSRSQWLLLGALALLAAIVLIVFILIVVSTL